MKFLDTLGRDIELEAEHYHAPAQAARFVFLFASAVAVQSAAGAPLVGWADLRALLVGALGVAFRQWFKTVPVSAVLRVVEDAKDVPQAPVAAPKA